MSKIVLDTASLGSLKGKVIVLTGGANGIGKTAVSTFHGHGCKVVFGDVSVKAGQALETSIGSSSVKFVQCDVTRYQNQLDLFSRAQELFGRVDIVIANAGIHDAGDVFAADEPLEAEPKLRELDVNLKGALFTSKIGMAYLRKSGGGDLILVSSIAGFKEATSMTPYIASKHGILGILRGLRISAIQEGIRVNAICPWMTRTGMVTGIEDGWYKHGLPVNEPMDVVTSFLICVTSGPAEDNNNAKSTGSAAPFSGKILYIAGGDTYEIEDNLQALEPQWLGSENSRVLKLGQAYLEDPSTSWAK